MTVTRDQVLPYLSIVGRIPAKLFQEPHLEKSIFPMGSPDGKFVVTPAQNEMTIDGVCFKDYTDTAVTPFMITVKGSLRDVIPNSRPEAVRNFTSHEEKRHSEIHICHVVERFGHLSGW